MKKLISKIREIMQNKERKHKEKNENYWNRFKNAINENMTSFQFESTNKTACIIDVCNEPLFDISEFRIIGKIPPKNILRRPVKNTSRVRRSI